MTFDFIIYYIKCFFSITSQENGDKVYRGVQSVFQGPSRITTSPTKTLTAAAASFGGSNGQQNGGGSDKSKGPPDKPGRNNKVNVKETLNKHRNWANSITGSGGGGVLRSADSVDSVRRSSVQNDHKPSLLSGGANFKNSGKLNFILTRNNRICIPITFNNPLKVCFSNRKILLKPKPA